jgi:hypothetical protein
MLHDTWINTRAFNLRLMLIALQLLLDKPEL